MPFTVPETYSSKEPDIGIRWPGMVSNLSMETPTRQFYDLILKTQFIIDAWADKEEFTR